MQNSLVALNIISNKKLLNKTEVPILFYWDGTSSILDSVFEDPLFQSFLKNTVLNSENYAIAKVALFYFKYENNEEIYKDEVHNIQDIIKFSNLNADDSSFYKEYLWKHFAFLYESAYHESYKGEDVSVFDIYDDIDGYILDIYDKIQNKYPKRVIKSTVINYIRGELQKTDNLSIENSDWIIAQLEKLLTERE